MPYLAPQAAPPIQVEDSLLPRLLASLPLLLFYLYGLLI